MSLKIRLIILGFAMIIIPVALYYNGITNLLPYIVWGIPTVVISIYIRIYRREYIKAISIGSFAALAIGLAIGFITGDMGLFTRHHY